MSLTEQYESFLESLEEKGIPNPKILVPAAALVLVAVFVLLAFPNLLAGEQTLSFTVTDNAGAKISGATVELFADGATLDKKTSDQNGAVSFKAPAGKALKIRIEHERYESFNGGISPDRKTIQLTALPPKRADVIVKVVDENGEPVDSADIIINFDDGTTRATSTDEYGEAQASVTEISHATVKVDKDGFRSKTKSFTSSELRAPVTVELQSDRESKPPESKVNLVVRITDEEDNPVDGVRVTLSDETTYAEISTRTSDAFGSALFPDVAAGRAISLSVDDDQGRYESTTTGGKTASSSEIQIRLKAVKSTETRLSVRIRDEAQNPLEGVDVTAYGKGTKTFLNSDVTDENGRVSLLIEERNVYLTLSKEGYLPLGLFALNSDEKTLTLKSAEGKTAAVKVNVKQNGEPAPSATVQLLDSAGFPLGLPSTMTGADGTAEFDAPTGTSAYAAASLDANTGKSALVTVAQGSEFFVNLETPKVKYEVRLLDAVSQKPVKDAKVSFLRKQERQSCTTGPEGSCSVEAPAESEFVFSVSHNAYLPYTSSTVFLLADASASNKAEVRLYPRDLTTKAQVQFLGFFDASGRTLREVENTQRFSGKWVVTLPAKSDFSRLTVFSGTKDRVEEEVLAIRGFDGTPKAYSGMAASEACSPAESSANASESHWVILEFPKGFSASQEVTVDFFVKASAKGGQAVSVPYHLYGTTQNVPFLVPQDDEKLKTLLNLETPAAADFCGAKMRAESLKIGGETLSCQDGFCQKATFLSDGRKSRSRLETEIGKEFTLELEAVGLDSGISGLRVSAPESIDLVSLEPTTGNGTFLSDSLSLTFSAGLEEKVKAILKAKALRASSASDLSVAWQTETGEVESNRQVVIKGTNRFNVATSLTEAEVAQRVNLRITVKDRLGRPVNDANVKLYECSKTPLNGQEPELTNEGTNGVFRIALEPSSLGFIGVRVEHPLFQTYDQCEAIKVVATDFLEANPTEIRIEGDTRQGKINEQITLTSTLPGTKMTVTSSTACTDENGKKMETPIQVQKTVTLKETATVDIEAKKTTSKGNCEITFLGKVNKDTQSQVIVLADVDLTGPPAPDKICPQNAKCLPASEGQQLSCLKTAFACEDETLSCFTCNLGPQTLPPAISMSVSNYQPDDTQTFGIALEEEPQECRIEGFRNNPTSIPPYYGGYGGYPGYGGIGTPGLYGYGQQSYGYYQYRPNGYAPGTPVKPEVLEKLSPQCQEYFQQSQYSSNYNNGYYANSYTNPWSTGGYPNTGYGGYNPLGSGTQYPTPGNFVYNQQQPTVSVTATCSRTELLVSAQYTGGDITYGGGLGGTQSGFLLIRTQGQTKKVPISVNVQNPFTGQIPYPPSQVGQIAPFCLQELRDAEKTVKKDKEKNVEAGLDGEGIPEEVIVYVNPYNGKGKYERKLDAPSGGALKVTSGSKGTFTVRNSGNTLIVEAKCPVKEGNADCKDGTFKATWGFEKQEESKKDRSIRLVQDDFSPAIIQLLSIGQVADTATYAASTDVGGKCESKASGVSIACRGSEITATARTSGSGELTIKNTDEYNTRYIPVYASRIEKSAVDLNAGSGEGGKATLPINPELHVKADCNKADSLSALEVECGTKNVVLKAGEIPAGQPDQKGLLAFQFPDSTRPENQKPVITVTIKKTGAGAASQGDVLITFINSQAGTLEFTYEFPEGDDPGQRLIVLRKDTGAAELSRWSGDELKERKANLKYPKTAAGQPALQDGKYLVHIETVKTGTPKIQKDYPFTYKQGQITTDTPQTPGTEGPGGEGPGGQAPAPGGPRPQVLNRPTSPVSFSVTHGEKVVAKLTGTISTGLTAEIRVAFFDDVDGDGFPDRSKYSNDKELLKNSNLLDSFKTDTSKNSYTRQFTRQKVSSALRKMYSKGTSSLNRVKSVLKAIKEGYQEEENPFWGAVNALFSGGAQSLEQIRDVSSRTWEFYEILLDGGTPTFTPTSVEQAFPFEQVQFGYFVNIRDSSGNSQQIVMAKGIHNVKELLKPGNAQAPTAINFKQDMENAYDLGGDFNGFSIKGHVPDGSSDPIFVMIEPWKAKDGKPGVYQIIAEYPTTPPLVDAKVLVTFTESGEIASKASEVAGKALEVKTEKDTENNIIKITFSGEGANQITAFGLKDKTGKKSGYLDNLQLEAHSKIVKASVTLGPITSDPSNQRLLLEHEIKYRRAVNFLDYYFNGKKAFTLDATSTPSRPSTPTFDTTGLTSVQKQALNTISTSWKTGALPRISHEPDPIPTAPDTFILKLKASGSYEMTNIAADLFRERLKVRAAVRGYGYSDYASFISDVSLARSNCQSIDVKSVSQSEIANNWPSSLTEGGADKTCITLYNDGTANPPSAQLQHVSNAGATSTYKISLDAANARGWFRTLPRGQKTAELNVVDVTNGGLLQKSSINTNNPTQAQGLLIKLIDAYKAPGSSRGAAVIEIQATTNTGAGPTTYSDICQDAYNVVGYNTVRQNIFGKVNQVQNKYSEPDLTFKGERANLIIAIPLASGSPTSTSNPLIFSSRRTAGGTTYTFDYELSVLDGTVKPDEAKFILKRKAPRPTVPGATYPAQEEVCKGIVTKTGVAVDCRSQSSGAKAPFSLKLVGSCIGINKFRYAPAFSGTQISIPYPQLPSGVITNWQQYLQNIGIAWSTWNVPALNKAGNLVMIEIEKVGEIRA